MYSYIVSPRGSSNTSTHYTQILHGITSLGSNPRPPDSAALAPSLGRSISAGGSAPVGSAHGSLRSAAPSWSCGSRGTYLYSWPIYGGAARRPHWAHIAKGPPRRFALLLLLSFFQSEIGLRRSAVRRRSIIDTPEDEVVVAPS